MCPENQINWDVFNWKYSSNKQNAFENLSYLIFCNEFNVKQGIFRYFNQTGIETNPIEVNNFIIGFQSKFYEDTISLSSKTKELKISIESSKRKNPTINKILFYINKEFKESSKKDEKKPAYQIEIEEHAKAQGIEIEWRGKSHFEKILSQQELVYIKDLYFNPNSDIKCFIDEIDKHSINLIDNLKSEICFKSEKIKIENNQYVSTLCEKVENNQTVIIVGEGGTGKSAVLKDWFKYKLDGNPCIFLKSTDFNVNSIYELMSRFGNYTLEDMLNVYKEENKKYLIIDSAEKLFTLDNKDTFIEAVKKFLKKKWIIIYSIRTAYIQDLLNMLKDLEIIRKYDTVEIEKISISDLKKISDKYKFLLPEDEKLKILLTNLFYLKIYTQCAIKEGDLIDIKSFKEYLWSNVIKKNINKKNDMNISREKCLISLAKECITEGKFYANMNGIEQEVLTNLQADEIISYDDSFGGYFVVHDIYEELIHQRILDIEFNSKISTTDFFNKIGDGLIIRRAFQIWIKEKVDSIEMLNFFNEILHDDKISKVWQDQTIILLLNSNNANMLDIISNILIQSNYKELSRIMSLLKTGCKVIDTDNSIFKNVFANVEEKEINKYMFLKPNGIGWEYIIKFIYENFNSINLTPKLNKILISIIKDWTQNKKDGKTTKFAGSIALLIYNNEINKKYIRLSNEDFKDVMSVILMSANEITDELKKICEEIVGQNNIDYHYKHYKLCEYILTEITDCFELFKKLPQLFFQIANKFWRKHERKEQLYYSHIEQEEYFGLSCDFSREYHPTSSFKTPLLGMLNIYPKETIDFLLDLSNYTVENYLNSEIKYECQMIYFNVDGKDCEQIISDRLWKIHRGTGNSPNLLECLYMAFERWLLNYIEESNKDEANSICKYILKNTKSAAVTSVIVSAILANPEKLFEISMILLPVKEILLFDLYRFVAESSSNFFRGFIPANEMYDNERINTNKKDFRNKKLEDIIFNYQLEYLNNPSEMNKQRYDKIVEEFDKQYNLNSDKKIDENNSDWLFALSRMDTRKLKATQQILVDGKEYLQLETDLPSDLIKISKDVKIKNEKNYELIYLNNWANYRFSKNEEKYCKYEEYEKDIKIVLQKIKELSNDEITNDINQYIINNIIITTSAVLIRDFKNLINNEEYEFCKKKILDFLEKIVYGEYIFQIGDGAEQAISTLTIIINDYIDIKISKNNPNILQLFLMCHEFNDIMELAIKNFSQCYYNQNYNACKSILSSYVKLQKIINNDKDHYQRFSSNTIWEKYSEAIAESFEKEIEIKDIELLPISTCIQIFKMIDCNFTEMDDLVLILIDKIGEKIYDSDICYREHLDYLSYFNYLSKYILDSNDSRISKISVIIRKHLKCDSNTEIMLRNFIFYEDIANKPNEFWKIWNLLFSIIVDICVKDKEKYLKEDDYDYKYYNHELDEIVKTYSLAFDFWNKKAKEWHTFQKTNTLFIQNLCTNIGFMPIMLYCTSYLLNSIASSYIDEGIEWLYTILYNNKHLSKKQLYINTIYYMEVFMRKYLYKNNNELKRNLQLKNKVIVILDFLVDYGSTSAYILRETIV